VYNIEKNHSCQPGLRLPLPPALGSEDQVLVLLQKCMEWRGSNSLEEAAEAKKAAICRING
jgi:hypothetical protein